MQQFSTWNEDLYQTINNQVQLNVQACSQSTEYRISDSLFSSLLTEVIEEYFTHPCGEYLGNKHDLKSDANFTSQNLIKNTHRVAFHGYAIQEAINRAHQTGGKVILAGSNDNAQPTIYYSGALELKSNVELHIEKNAILRFIRNKTNHYYPLVFTRFEGVELINFSPLIYANHAHNIAISGEGILDGNADEYNWMPWKFGYFGELDQEIQRQRLFNLGQQNTDVEQQRIFNDEVSTLRPPFIQFYNSQNILLQDFTLINSPFWCINPVLSSNILAKKLTIKSNLYNNDGFDPESCDNIIVENCIFKTGDDCIAIKSGRNNDGRRINIPCQNMIIRNNQFEDGHGGITVGSEISGGVRNILAHDNFFDSPELDYPIRFKTNAQRGGVLENIYIKNSTINKSKIAVIHADFFYEEGENGNHLPQLRNIALSNIKTIANGSIDAQYPLYMRGFKNAPIENVWLENINLQGVEGDSILENVHKIVFNNVTVNDTTLPNQTLSI